MNPHNGNLVFHNHLKSKEKCKLDPLLGTFDLTRKVKAESAEYFKSIKLSPPALAQPASGQQQAPPPPPGQQQALPLPSGQEQPPPPPGEGEQPPHPPGEEASGLGFNAGVARRRSGRRSQATQSVLAAQAQGRERLATDRSACPPLYSM